MPFSVEYNPQENIINVIVTGRVDINQFKTLAAEIINTVKQKNCTKVLTDLREADLFLSTMEIYELPGFISNKTKEQDVELHRVKRAFVISEKNMKQLYFYETVSINQGIRTKLFHSLEEAKSWL